MKNAVAIVFFTLLGAALGAFSLTGATDDETPIGPRWWPSPWGAGDQKGAANRMTADKVKEASKLIQAGRVYSLGRVYEHGMPLPGNRH